jgi:hypothetical protein
MGSMQTLKKYINTNLEKVGARGIHDSSDYCEMRRLALTRLVSYNGRRVNEPGYITIAEMRDSFDDKWIDKRALDRQCTDEEKKKISLFHIAYADAKNTSTEVSTIIPKTLKCVISKLMDTVNRKKAGVHDDNIFVFAQTHNSEEHASGWHDVANIIEKALPTFSTKEKISSTIVRHYLSTLFAELRLGKEATDIFCKHLGHNPKVNAMVYQAPLAIRTLLEVAPFLDQVDSGKDNHLYLYQIKYQYCSLLLLCDSYGLDNVVK